MTRNISTGGGAYVEGGISTGGGDFVGGNRQRSFTNKEVARMIDLLSHFRVDALMALNGTWDCGDAGFQCQVESVDGLFAQLGIKPTVRLEDYEDEEV